MVFSVGAEHLQNNQVYINRDNNNVLSSSERINLKGKTVQQKTTAIMAALKKGQSVFTIGKDGTVFEAKLVDDKIKMSETGFKDVTQQSGDIKLSVKGDLTFKSFKQPLHKTPENMQLAVDHYSDRLGNNPQWSGEDEAILNSLEKDIKAMEKGATFENAEISETAKLKMKGFIGAQYKFAIQLMRKGGKENTEAALKIFKKMGEVVNKHFENQKQTTLQKDGSYAEAYPHPNDNASQFMENGFLFFTFGISKGGIGGEEGLSSLEAALIQSSIIRPGATEIITELNEGIKDKNGQVTVKPSFTIGKNGEVSVNKKALNSYIEHKTKTLSDEDRTKFLNKFMYAISFYTGLNKTALSGTMKSKSGTLSAQQAKVLMPHCLQDISACLFGEAKNQDKTAFEKLCNKDGTGRTYQKFEALIKSYDRTNQTPLYVKFEGAFERTKFLTAYASAKTSKRTEMVEEHQNKYSKAFHDLYRNIGFDPKEITIHYRARASLESSG